MKTQRRRPCDDGGRDCRDASTNQGFLESPRTRRRPSKGTVLHRIPEHSMQHHLQPCPVSSGSVGPTPVWSESLERETQRGLLSFTTELWHIGKRTGLSNKTALFYYLFKCTFITSAKVYPVPTVDQALR